MMRVRIKKNSDRTIQEICRLEIERTNMIRHIKYNRFGFYSLVTMIIIFLFSSQTAAESGHLSNNLKDALNPYFNNVFSIVDIRNIAHFTLFGILGGLLFTHLRYTKQYKYKVIYYLFALFLTACYAIFDEVHQFFIQGRGCELSDVFIDLSGCMTVLIINAIIITILEIKHRRGN